MIHRCFVVLGLTWAALVPRALGGGGDVALAPRQGVLLLTNGEVIAGTITPSGDRYDVHLPDGELHLKRGEVVGAFRDLQECYAHKRAALDPSSVQASLDLVEWCLKNELVAEAEKELAAARALDGAHPRVRLLEARLHLAQENAHRPPPSKGPEKPAPDAQAQLDRMIRNLPAGSVETFTNAVQPILLNYCSRAGCHGAQSTGSLRLERVSTRLAGRHPTQRNLQAALALVDTRSPEASKLLQAPIRAHGTLRAPIFTDREHAQYKQLVQWVYLVSNTKTASAPPSLNERSAPLLQTLPRGDKGAGNEAPEAKQDSASAEGEKHETSEAARPRPPAADWSEAFPDQTSGRAAESQRGPQTLRATRIRGQTVLRPTARQADAPAEFVPKDPFDPEIFNRRFFPPQ